MSHLVLKNTTFRDKEDAFLVRSCFLHYASNGIGETTPKATGHDSELSVDKSRVKRPERRGFEKKRLRGLLKGKKGVKYLKSSQGTNGRVVQN